MLVFQEGGKPENPENPEKNPRSKTRTNNKLNPHMAPARIRPGPHWWVASALTTVPSLLPGLLQSVPISDFTISSMTFESGKSTKDLQP